MTSLFQPDTDATSLTPLQCSLIASIFGALLVVGGSALSLLDII